MQVIPTASEITRSIQSARDAGKRVGLVLTMGALHEGHLRLVDASRNDCDVTAVTIFVNPTQFAPSEDLDRYPRRLDEDLRLLAGRGADLVFTPSVDEMYPPDFSTYVHPPRTAEGLESLSRPNHFRGVATVVLKLFHLLPAHVAYFGQKDYQQTRVIHDMVRDLAVPIEIRVCPTVREQDGLAMSSRNQYLSPELRVRAPALYRSLQHGERLIREGEMDVERIVDAIWDKLEEAGISSIDYVAVADPHSLAALNEMRLPLVLLAAVRLGSTRLIDNCIVSASQ